MNAPDRRTRAGKLPTGGQMSGTKQNHGRGTVLYWDGYGRKEGGTLTAKRDYVNAVPVAVIPCATLRQARAIVRLHAMTEGQFAAFLNSKGVTDRLGCFNGNSYDVYHALNRTAK